jgi:hypothetical protein
MVFTQTLNKLHIILKNTKDIQFVIDDPQVILLSIFILYK